jgi:2-iminobutanoate/2-iminopropanoate deaminase
MRTPVETDKAPRPVGPYSQAIIHGDFVFVSGQGPTNPATGEREPGDIKAQTRRTLDNMKAILEAAGSSLANVVKCNVYLRDIGDFQAMNEVYTSFFSAPPPARTTIQAGALPGGIAVEIDCTAHR